MSNSTNSSIFTGQIDEKLKFKAINIAVLSVTGAASIEDDVSGQILARGIKASGHQLAERKIIDENQTIIEHIVGSWINDAGIDAVIVSGGTGATQKDVTLNAIRPLLETELEGFSTVWHSVGLDTIGLSTALSRACLGVAKASWVFAIPGGEQACQMGWDNIISKMLDSRYQPSNLVDLMSQLK